MLAGDAGPGFRRAPQATQTEALALAYIAAPDARLWNWQPSFPGDRDLAPGRFGTEHDPEKWKLVFRKGHAQTGAKALRGYQL
jgi:hypothetical protein